MSNKKLIGMWRAMHNRCYNKNQSDYKNYGSRGIFVHDSWHGAEGYAKFVADMGERPEGATIDRIDNDGPYSPDNCRWATRLEQSRNKRNNRWITANGETKTLKDWATSLGCNPAAILARIKSGMSEAVAVTKPVPERPNAKLTVDAVRVIRSTYPAKTMQQLANDLGVSKKTVMNVVHRKIFVDVN